MTGYSDPMPSGPEFEAWQKRYVMRELADMATDPEMAGLASALFSFFAENGESEEEGLARIHREAESWLIAAGADVHSPT